MFLWSFCIVLESCLLKLCLRCFWRENQCLLQSLIFFFSFLLVFCLCLSSFVFFLLLFFLCLLWRSTFVSSPLCHGFRTFAPPDLILSLWILFGGTYPCISLTEVGVREMLVLVVSTGARWKIFKKMSWLLHYLFVQLYVYELRPDQINQRWEYLLKKGVANKK